jgi:predicted RNA-binding protein YlqC (UPF0109 family)
MKELIDYVIRALVDHPDDVRVTSIEGDRTMIYEVRCHAKDIGKVIGKSGKTVAAIRTILSTAASKAGKRAVLEVVE